MKGCFAVGLYKQGLLHDLSKYTPTEFLVGCKYYQGTMSPNNAERRIRDTRPRGCTTKGGTSIIWNTGLTTACRTRAGDKGLCGMKMPLRYVVEMYIDRVAASKNYQKERYTDRSALEYYLHGKDFHVMHKDTRALLELLFVPARCPGRAGSQYIYPRRTAGREDPL